MQDCSQKCSHTPVKAAESVYLFTECVYTQTEEYIIIFQNENSQIGL